MPVQANAEVAVSVCRRAVCVRFIVSGQTNPTACPKKTDLRIRSAAKLHPRDPISLPRTSTDNGSQAVRQRIHATQFRSSPIRLWRRVVRLLSHPVFLRQDAVCIRSHANRDLRDYIRHPNSVMLHQNNVILHPSILVSSHLRIFMIVAGSLAVGGRGRGCQRRVFPFVSRSFFSRLLTPDF